MRFFVLLALLMASLLLLYLLNTNFGQQVLIQG